MQQVFELHEVVCTVRTIDPDPQQIGLRANQAEQVGAAESFPVDAPRPALHAFQAAALFDPRELVEIAGLQPDPRNTGAVDGSSRFSGRARGWGLNAITFRRSDPACWSDDPAGAHGLRLRPHIAGARGAHARDEERLQEHATVHGAAYANRVVTVIACLRPTRPSADETSPAPGREILRPHVDRPGRADSVPATATAGVSWHDAGCRSLHRAAVVPPAAHPARKSLSPAGVELHRAFQEIFDSPEIVRASGPPASFRRLIAHHWKVGERVLRRGLDEAGKARRDLLRHLRRDASHLTEELIRPGIRGREIGRVAERSDRVLGISTPISTGRCRGRCAVLPTVGTA